MPFPFVSRKTLEQQELRLTALTEDFQRHRERTRTIETDAFSRGQADTLKAIFPVYDNLKRALEQPCGDEAFLSGVEMTFAELRRTLESLGVQEIPAQGAAFDPLLHEAMEHIDDPELGENTVARVVLTGFTREGTVLRHALVVVAN